MSIRVMTEVWQHSRTKGSGLLLLLAIADFADDDGLAFPAVPTLARKIRMTPRNTQLLARSVEKTGELVVREGAGPNGVNLYKVNLAVLRGEKFSPPEKFSGVKAISPGGEKSSHEGVKHVSPKSSCKEEPSWNRQAAAAKPAAAATVTSNSKFDLDTIEAFIRETKPHSTNPPALARLLNRTGEDDLEIEAWLDGEQAEIGQWLADLEAEKAMASRAVERWCFGESISGAEASAILAVSKRQDRSGRFEVDHVLLRVASELLEITHQQSVG